MKNLEELPKRESTSKYKQFGWDAKSCRKYKGTPAHRYLQSKVGAAWNDVWSDICKNKTPNFKKSISWQVELSFAGFDKFGNAVDSEGHYVYRFYVDGYGFLRKAPNLRFRNSVEGVAKPLDFVVLDGILYGRWNDLWYELTLETIPEARYKWVENTYWSKENQTYPVFDVWFGSRVGNPDDSFYKNGTYCVGYRQVGKKTLKRIRGFINGE